MRALLKHFVPPFKVSGTAIIDSIGKVLIKDDGFGIHKRATYDDGHKENIDLFSTELCAIINRDLCRSKKSNKS